MMKPHVRCLALLLLSPVAAAAQSAAASDRSPQALYFPPSEGSWETVTPQAADWDEAALDAALEYAREQRTSGVVVLHRGRILAEEYWELAPAADDPLDRVHQMTTGRTALGQAVEDVASIQKSVLSFLAGIARGKALLDFDAPVARYLGAGWSKASAEQEAAITVRHLLGMTTGLAMDGSYQAPPATKWMYNTPVYSKLVQVLEKASGLTVHEYTKQWLTDRIGMRDTRWTPRPWMGQPGAGDGEGNTIGLSTSARDLARFGILVSAGGMWEGQDVLGDPKYLAEAFTPAQSHNPSYGLLWWLNGKASTVAGGEVKAGPLIPTAPPDLVAAQGALGRRLDLVPSLDLVVARLGDEPARGFGVELWRRLMAAAPGRSPR
jgi:CubicO group peptidase (beta-lactamase class C family)